MTCIIYDIYNFACFFSQSPASFAFSGTDIDMLLLIVTLEDAINNLFCEFEGSTFSILTSHTYTKKDKNGHDHQGFKKRPVTVKLVVTKSYW